MAGKLEKRSCGKRAMGVSWAFRNLKPLNFGPSGPGVVWVADADAVAQVNGPKRAGILRRDLSTQTGSWILGALEIPCPCLEFILSIVRFD